LLVAETATVIDQLAPGRFVIGLGNGGVSEPPKDGGPSAQAADEVDLLALQRWGNSGDRPVARMREHIEVIRLALAGETVDYSGEFQRFQGVKLSITPEREIPIYLGARRGGMLRLAGEAADGVFFFLVGRESSSETIGIVRDAAVSSGRRADDVKIGALIPMCVSEDGDAARSAMRRYLVDFYLGRGPYADVLAASGFPALGQELCDRVSRGDNEGAGACITDEALDEIAISGAPDHCRSLLADWAERGVEVPVLYVFPPDGDWGKAYHEAISMLAPGA
jgi:alkanesulfonate monooxygenase SsuD/methylene tetrahydromethanopterin reductase-like flavin-dependent oxidoreductase (luciferase family)